MGAEDQATTAACQHLTTLIFWCSFVDPSTGQEKEMYTKARSQLITHMILVPRVYMSASEYAPQSVSEPTLVVS